MSHPFLDFIRQSKAQAESQRLSLHTVVISECEETLTNQAIGTMPPGSWTLDKQRRFLVDGVRIYFAKLPPGKWLLRLDVKR